MLKTINIREPFYSAGKKYGWEGATIGLGIKLEKLNGEGELLVTVGDKKDVWKIDKKTAREFVDKYKSTFNPPRGFGTVLGVIAWSQFTRVIDPIKETKEPQQLTLVK